MTRSVLRRTLALLALPSLVAGALLSAPPAAAAPGVDQVDSSPNLTRVAGLPKSGALKDSVNSDMAFQGDLAFVGNYNGFTVYDVSQPRAPREVVQVVCPGSQNDISVSGDLLFLSTDSRRTDSSCASGAASATTLDPWEGIKVFDIADPAAPKYVAAVETACGSHTHTVVPGKGDDSKVFVYVSSYSPSATTPGCTPPHDRISIVEVPRATPQDARVVATPLLFGTTGVAAVDGLVGGGASGTSGCHDITVFPSKDLAAGACMGDGLLMDISDRVAPKVVARISDPNFAFWHSATFNRDATKVIFTDELGGGGAATCNPGTGPTRGADAIYTLSGTTLTFASYFKIPRENTAQENCVAHNGSLIPVPGRDVFVQAWYQGGISVFDFTDATAPREIAYWERGPLSSTSLVTGGSWSAYWYNGAIFSSDITKGLDVLELTGDTSGANGVRLPELNVQSQPDYR